MVRTNKKKYADKKIYMQFHNTIHMYSGITSGRVLDGRLPIQKPYQINIKYIYKAGKRMSTNAICPVDWREISMKQSISKCEQINL